MAHRKNEKIPYLEYQKIKEQNAKKKFKLMLYPPMVLTAVLLPLAVFFLAMIWYFANAKKFLE